MTLESIRAIFKQMVIDMMYGDLQVNSFVNITSDPKIREQSFGASYEDYQAGDFWARDWVNQGADPGTIAGTFPVLFYENRRVEMYLNQDEQSDRVYVNLLLLDKFELGCCDTSGRIMTRARVFDRLVATMRSLILRLEQTKVYAVDDHFEYITSSKAQYYDDNGKEVKFIRILDLIDTPVTISEWGNNPDIVGVWCEMSFTLCLDTEQPEYRDDAEVVEGVAINRCPC